MNKRILEMMQVALGFGPIALTTARDGDWVNMENFDRIGVAFLKGSGTAGDDPTITMEQAQDNAAAGAKALNFALLWKKQGADLTALGEFTETANPTADNSYTDTDSAEVPALWWLEFAKEDLDIENGFTHLRARLSDVGTNAQLGAVLYFGVGPRHAPAGSMID